MFAPSDFETPTPVPSLPSDQPVLPPPPDQRRRLWGLLLLLGGLLLIVWFSLRLDQQVFIPLSQTLAATQTTQSRQTSPAPRRTPQPRASQPAPLATPSDQQSARAIAPDLRAVGPDLAALRDTP